MVGCSICPAYLLAGWLHHPYLQRYEQLNPIFSTDLCVPFLLALCIYTSWTAVCASQWHGSVWTEMVIETRLWSTPAVLLWKEAGIGNLAQMWQPLLFLPAQQVLLQWACSVSTPAVQSHCIGWGFNFSLPRNCNPQPPHVLNTREHPLELVWL